MTKIEWTDETWNPVTGCTKVSQGCRACYAERLAPKVFAGQRVPDMGGDDPYASRPRVFTDVRCHPERLDAPLHWKKPRRIFVNSMSDLFHEDVPDEFIDKIFAVMARCPQHTFQVLTKRPKRMLEYLGWPFRPASILQIDHEAPPDLATGRWPLPNVWLGVSVEDQETADERIPLLLQTPAAVRFISAEPLLGPIDLDGWLPGLFEWKHERAMLGWVIAGGESGPKARPSHPDWFRSLRDQCAAAGVPYFFKQWGEHLAGEFDKKQNTVIEWQDGRREWYGDHQDIKYADSWLSNEVDRLVIAYRIGKKKAGRLLDGRTHDEYPA
jgi:protein gp37